MSTFSRRQFLAIASVLPLSACWRQRGPLRSTDVAVIGAGLAGLAAAWRLQQAGYEVVVLEASDRFGGRTYTGRDLPDRPEYGAVQVGGGYQRMHATAQRLGVEIAPYPHRFPAPVYYVNGTNMTAEQWSGLQASREPTDFRATPPSRLLYSLLSKNPLDSELAWSQSPASDRSLLAVLKEQGATDEALRLIEVNANNNGLATVSALAEFRSGYLRTLDRTSEVVTAGSDTLATAMAAKLVTPVARNQAVEQINVSRDYVDLVTASGGRWRAKQVIAAIPPAALRRIQIEAPFAPGTADAINGFEFTAVSQLYIDAEPFWEDDGLSPYMWTDGPLERLFPRISPAGEIVGFKVWLNGQGALTMDARSDRAVADIVERELVKMRPASAGRFSFNKRISWTDNPLAGGAYPEWLAGKVSTYAEAVRQPAGRLRLAGDYTSRVMTGMEGAFEGGELAASEVIAALS